MLADKNVTTMIAVRDLAKAKKFYQGVLGLEPVKSQGDHVIVFRSGKSEIDVYRSEFAGTNKATTLTWTVGEALESVVRDLESKGVKFEHYEMPGMKVDGHIHVGDGMKVAWFKDPDGNILSIASR